MATCFIPGIEVEDSIEKEGVTITISGLTGSGKSSLAEFLSKELELKHITIGKIFRDIAEERGIDIAEYDKISEEAVNKEADKRTLQLSITGGYVIEGRLASLASGKYSDLKIFLTAPIEVRAERVSKRNNISFDAAFHKVEERDKAVTKRYMDLYGIDLLDLSIYDLVLNNEKISKDETGELVLYIIKKMLKI